MNDNTSPIPVAILYDFDKTLSTRDMQEYSFIPGLGLEPAAFWAEAGELAKREQMDSVLAYMYLMLRKSRDMHRSIRREDFVKAGSAIEFYPGVTEWFSAIRTLGENLGVTVEHYLISSGMRELLEGCGICNRFRRIYACEFLYDENGLAVWPKLAVNYTNKTQFLFRINKGILDISEDAALNRYAADELRPVPFSNMIYIGDGLTDVPCMKLVRVNGGQSVAVYDPNGDESHLGNVHRLLEEGRVDFIAPADYRTHAPLFRLTAQMLEKIAVGGRLKAEHRRQKDAISIGHPTDSFFF